MWPLTSARLSTITRTVIQNTSTPAPQSPTGMTSSHREPKGQLWPGDHYLLDTSIQSVRLHPNIGIIQWLVFVDRVWTMPRMIHTHQLFSTKSILYDSRVSFEQVYPDFKVRTKSSTVRIGLTTGMGILLLTKWWLKSGHEQVEGLLLMTCQNWESRL